MIERGCRHILSQKEILDEVKLLNPLALTVPASDVKRELRDYEIADRIVVASRHVVQSFIEKGIPEGKLFRNPYGVDLSMFGPTETPKGEPTLLMTGTWCYRKGCDLLVRALQGTNYRLLHAGIIRDLPFPKDPNFVHLGFVDQTKLKAIYAQAHVFVLPSREEGLALVQAQALACGLFLVCSNRTGGEDLGEMLEDKKLVTVVKTGDVEDLRNGIEKAVSYAISRQGSRKDTSPSFEKLSWKAYGEKYDLFLRNWLMG